MNGLPTRDTLIAELDIASLPPDIQDEMIAGVGQNVMTHVLTVLLARLSDDVQEQFKALIETGQGVEAEALAKAHIPDLDVYIASEVRVALDEFKKLQGGIT